MQPHSLEDYKEQLKRVKQFPIEFIKTNGVIKLQENQTSLTLGYVKSLPKSKKLRLEHLHRDKEIIYQSVNQSELTSYISKNSTTIATNGTKRLEENDLNRLANDAPIINLVNSIIIDGINSGASDIHIEGYKSTVDLRYRVDGVLISGDPLKPDLFSAISSRIKIMANLNIMERRQPQDGRVSVTLEGANVDLRISILPLSGGESIVLRLFTKKNDLLSLTDLGFKGANLNRMEHITTYPHGLILITGPTGSGKTTTLNALLQKLDNRGKKIITIEDPVEYTIPGVNQIQVNHDIDLGFSDILRRVLRQDPDVIMIGEIRDRETAELVIRAALTGHLVLSTLHTNDAVTSISRLKDLGVEDYLITSVLKAGFAQRLIRTICKECKGVGCKNCMESGYRGRVAITEGFIMDEELESLILNSAKPYQLRHHLEKVGSKSLYEAGLDLVDSGLTTMEEINRVLIC